MRTKTPWILTASLAIGLAVVAATTPGNLPDALRAQRDLVAQRPGDAGAQNDLGNLLSLAGDLDAAEEAYQRAVDMAPDRAAYHYNLALLQQQRDKLGRARDHFQRVVELTPDNAWAAYQIGAIHEEEGRRAAAIEWYGRAFRLDPELAFPDVNPSVIDSELTAEAMLRGYRATGTAAAAPRYYEEPARISLLLLPPLTRAGGEPAAPAPAPEWTAAAGSQRGGTGQALPPAGGTLAGGAEAPRVLTEDDLTESGVNQVNAPAAGGRPAGGRDRTSVVRNPARVYPGAIGYPQETAPVEDPQGRDAQPGTAAPPQRIDPRTGRPMFRPGLPSTGRLELILTPTPNERAG